MRRGRACIAGLFSPMRVPDHASSSQNPPHEPLAHTQQVGVAPALLDGTDGCGGTARRRGGCGPHCRGAAPGGRTGEQDADSGPCRARGGSGISVHVQALDVEPGRETQARCVGARQSRREVVADHTAQGGAAGASDHALTDASRTASVEVMEVRVCMASSLSRQSAPWWRSSS